MPPGVWDEALSQLGDDEPDEDEPFPQEAFGYGYHDGWFLGGWPTEDELRWFPKELIEKYGGSAEYTGPNYDQLYFPEGVADAIAEELRSRSHTVEKTETGDLADWIDFVGAYEAF